MAKPYTLTGTLKDGQTVTLDQALPLNGRVLLTLEPLPSESRKSLREILTAIRQRQRVRGHQPRSRQEVDAFLQSERESDSAI